MIYDFIDRKLKAIKEHRCDLCGCIIEKGALYTRQFHPSDKSVSKMHEECKELLRYEGFYDGDSTEGTSEDFFKEAILDYVHTYHVNDDDVYDKGWDVSNRHILVKMILKEQNEKGVSV